MIWILALLGGCYLSHQRADPADAGPHPRDAAVARDAGRLRDAGPEPDAGPIACDGLRVSATATLGAPGESAVTPRLVALPRGEVGVVYVEHGGSPTRVVYERLDRELTRLTGRVVVTESSFTWAEPVLVGDAIFIAYGVAGDDSSRMLTISLDGVARGPARAVALPHPSLLRPSAAGLFWMAFVMRESNALHFGYVRPDGEVFHGPFVVETGRYGSGHGAVARPDLFSHVVAYPREGPPGVRRGYLGDVGQSERLTERALGEGDARGVLPVRVRDQLVIVRSGDELVLETADLETLATLETRTFAAIEHFLVAGTAADRLVLAYAEAGVLRADDFGSDLDGPVRFDVPMPGSGTGAGPTGIASYPDAIVIAAGVNADRGSFPWLVRLECVP